MTDDDNWLSCQVEALKTALIHKGFENRVEAMWIVNSLFSADIDQLQIIASLDDVHDEVFDLLVEALKFYRIDDWDHTVEVPIGLLGALRYKQAVPFLLRFIEPDSPYWHEAAFALVRIGDVSAVEPLMKLYENPDEIANRTAKLRRRFQVEPMPVSEEEKAELHQYAVDSRDYFLLYVQFAGSPEFNAAIQAWRS